MAITPQFAATSWLRSCAALLLFASAPALAGPVERYREGPQFCPRDRGAGAPVLTEAQINERAIALVPGFCGPSFFVSGCDAEPEFVRGDWRVYVHQYKVRGAARDRSGLDHSYVILDPVGNCLANIPGTPLGALH